MPILELCMPRLVRRDANAGLALGLGIGVGGRRVGIVP
jgi:hypothetical protein